MLYWATDTCCYVDVVDCSINNDLASFRISYGKFVD